MGRDYKRVTNRPNSAYGDAALEEPLNALRHGVSYARFNDTIRAR